MGWNHQISFMLSFLSVLTFQTWLTICKSVQVVNKKDYVGCIIANLVNSWLPILLILYMPDISTIPIVLVSDDSKSHQSTLRWKHRNNASISYRRGCFSGSWHLTQAQRSVVVMFKGSQMVTVHASSIRWTSILTFKYWNNKLLNDKANAAPPLNCYIARSYADWWCC